MTLMDENLICLGLYRLRGAADNDYPYVYTNPNCETIVTHRDKVFVLAIDIPENLERDCYQPIDQEQIMLSGMMTNKRSKDKNAKNNRFVGIKEVQEVEDDIFGIKASKYCKSIVINVAFLEPQAVQALTKKLEDSVRVLEQEVAHLKQQVFDQNKKIISTVD